MLRSTGVLLCSMKSYHFAIDYFSYHQNAPQSSLVRIFVTIVSCITEDTHLSKMIYVQQMAELIRSRCFIKGCTKPTLSSIVLVLATSLKCSSVSPQGVSELLLV